MMKWQYERRETSSTPFSIVSRFLQEFASSSLENDFSYTISSQTHIAYIAFASESVDYFCDISQHTSRF